MKQPKNIITPRVIIQLILFVVIIPFLPLLISRHLDWWEAWIYALVSILCFIISRILAARRHPDVIAERAKSMQHGNTQPWDKLLAPLVGLGGGLVLVVAGLDELFGWSPQYSLSIKLIALVVILAGYALGAYALIENRFFSGVVRLQTERGHQVVSSGPYRWMRHPGYAGGLLTYLAVPLFLDSSWAFLPALFIWVVLIIRTHFEDSFLHASLEGYTAYSTQVRYRLFPGIW